MEPPKAECECGPTGPPPAEGDVIRVLLIDDDQDEYALVRELVKDIPGGRFTLDWTPDYEAGADAICSEQHDVFLLDYRLGARTGVDLLREANARGCNGPVILLTGKGDARTDREALQAGAYDYLEKDGLTPALLDRAIRFALAQFRHAAELERKVEERTEELAKANAALREADRRKDVFLATLAHELRNPLVPICNSLELIRLAGDNGAAVAKQRARLERQVASLSRLIDDLVDVARITNDKLQLTLEPLTVQEVVEAAVEMSRPRLDARKLVLTINEPPEPVPLVADRVRLTQVFSSLLNNAAKFTEAGGQVWLTATATPDTVTVTVRDNGMGIPAEVLPVVFTLFTQADRSPGGGLGIGLALVRRLVEMHGGHVAAHSEGPGQGAVFTVMLPTNM